MEQNERKVSFHPIAGSHTVSGEILTKWKETGAENGVLGYPVAQEVKYKNGACAMTFQRGKICSHPTFGTHYITGKFYYYWGDMLGVNGKYSYPVSDPYEKDGVTVQEFQGGIITSDIHQIHDEIDLRGEIARRGIDIRNQGTRGTCSVQVMVFMLEYLYTGLLGRGFCHLSVEFSNHFANVATGTREDGHCFYSMEDGYNQYGIIMESSWPYNKDWVYDYDQAQKLITEDMLNAGRRMIEGGLKLNGTFIKPLGEEPGLSQQQFDSMINILDKGIPVGVGRDHSLVAVGYERDDTQPGGGIILFRNSHGISPDFIGYQTETFEHVIKTVNDLYVYTYIE